MYPNNFGLGLSQKPRLEAIPKYKNHACELRTQPDSSLSTYLGMDVTKHVHFTKETLFVV